MVTDKQVRRLMKLNQVEKNLSLAADKCDISENTARKYLRLKRLPSQCKQTRHWRTRNDPFTDVWHKVEAKLEDNNGFEAKTIFQWLQRRYPGRFSDGQLRTLQRRIKQWRALEGPAKEVFFDQIHKPGQLCQSDFTWMNALGIRINGATFDHLVYHFVMTYSNWETVTICFSESFESLSTGLQNALWELGGVPAQHRTDRLSAAVQQLEKPGADEFTRRYRALLRHYGLNGQKIRTGKANENGDIEQRHHRFKRAVEQALLLRGSRDFASREQYEAFLCKLLAQINAGRRERFEHEITRLRSLPARRLDDYSRYNVRVGAGSTIRIKKNVYSVHSRLINEKVDVRLYADYLQVWYAQKKVATIPRLRGEKKHRVNYRHVIDWLVRKPGAFKNYRYRQDMFPSSRFKMAYDQLNDRSCGQADKQYLKILELAAKNSQTAVESAIGQLLEHNQSIDFKTVESIVLGYQAIGTKADVALEPVNLYLYDNLLETVEVC